MAVTFSLADLHVRLLVGAALRKYRPHLAEADVEVGVLFASSDKEDVPALKHRGAAVAASIKVVSLRDRVLKRVDAELCINKEVWEEMSPAERLALAHHELLHIDLADGKYVPVLDENGKRRFVLDEKTGEMVPLTELTFERDDLGRPKLKTVHGDIDTGDGFVECAEEHGEASLEWQSHRKGGRWADERLERHWERRKRERAEGPTAGTRVVVSYTTEAGEVVSHPVDLPRSGPPTLPFGDPDAPAEDAA